MFQDFYRRVLLETKGSLNIYSNELKFNCSSLIIQEFERCFLNKVCDIDDKGVYAHYVGDSVIYIGKSSLIKNRTRNHVRDFLFNLASYHLGVKINQPYKFYAWLNALVAGNEITIDILSPDYDAEDKLIVAHSTQHYLANQASLTRKYHKGRGWVPSEAAINLKETFRETIVKNKSRPPAASVGRGYNYFKLVEIAPDWIRRTPSTAIEIKLDCLSLVSPYH